MQNLKNLINKNLLFYNKLIQKYEKNIFKNFFSLAGLFLWTTISQSTCILFFVICNLSEFFFDESLEILSHQAC